MAMMAVAVIVNTLRSIVFVAVHGAKYGGQWPQSGCAFGCSMGGELPNDSPALRPSLP